MDEIHVVGAGGIGCAVGYALLATGEPITFVESNEAKLAWGRANGVGVGRRPFLPATFIPFAEWEPPRQATILLCTKCYDNPDVLARVRPENTMIPIQNGFDDLVEARRHAVEGIASFVSECEPEKTHTRITRGGRLHLGIRHRDTMPSTRSFDLLRDNRLFRVTWTDDIAPYKYTKLMYNAAISPLASLAGLDNGGLLFVRTARRSFFALLRENYAILREAGITLGKIGPFHPDTVNRILNRRVLANALAWAFYPSLRGTYCSMSADLPKGRTEIDNYNGRLIALAGHRPCPLNRRVYELVKDMEVRGTPPGLRLLDRLL